MCNNYWCAGLLHILHVLRDLHVFVFDFDVHVRSTFFILRSLLRIWFRLLGLWRLNLSRRADGGGSEERTSSTTLGVGRFFSARFFSVSWIAVRYLPDFGTVRGAAGTLGVGLWDTQGRDLHCSAEAQRDIQISSVGLSSSCQFLSPQWAPRCGPWCGHFQGHFSDYYPDLLRTLCVWLCVCIILF